MEGVGARLGRSSTRYGPATVFTGPVRKWKKRWVHVSPSAAASAATATNNRSHPTNGTTNGNNGSRILLYKWAPISQTTNPNGNGDKIPGEDLAPDAPHEPPRRRFKYVPVAVLEEQKNEAAENTDEEVKPSDVNPSEGEPTSISNSYDAKPDINDVPMEDSQAPDVARLGRQDLNESTLDLSFNLNARDSDQDPDSKTDQITDGRLERANPSNVGT